jgi:hypothetical protein
MKKIVFIFFLQLTPLLVFAQTGFENGYIINYKGEKVYGKIKDRKGTGYINSWQKIQFINNAGEMEKFTAEDILGYVKNDTTAYQTLALGIEEKKRFLAKVENAAVILFADIKGYGPKKVQAGPSPFGAGLYIYVRIGNATQKIEGAYYLQKKNDTGSLMEWRSMDYKRTAGYFFGEDKELLKAIEEDKFGFSDIQNIVKTYNEWKIRQ